MSKLIEMPSSFGTIIVEIETTDDEIVPVGNVGERIVQKVDQAFDKVESVIVNSCTLLTGALSHLAEKEPKLETASIKCGFQFTGEGNIYMVKTSAESSITVTMNLRMKEPMK